MVAPWTMLVWTVRAGPFIYTGVFNSEYDNASWPPGWLNPDLRRNRGHGRAAVDYTWINSCLAQQSTGIWKMEPGSVAWDKMGLCLGFGSVSLSREFNCLDVSVTDIVVTSWTVSCISEHPARASMEFTVSPLETCINRSPKVCEWPFTGTCR